MTGRAMINTFNDSTAMHKTDLRKTLPFYKAKNKPAVVELPELHYLSIEGKGDPNHSLDYQQAIEALFTLSYTLKFMVKKGPMAIDYSVMPLEALWWADDMNDFISGNKDRWKWKAMILQPGFITAAMVNEAKESAAKKKKLLSPDIVRFDSFSEGKCVQVLYTGPYADEGPVIRDLHAFAAALGLQLRGLHHEIYLNDFRRTAPEKLKTIIRQPVA